MQSYLEDVYLRKSKGGLGVPDPYSKTQKHKSPRKILYKFCCASPTSSISWLCQRYGWNETRLQ